MTTKMVNFTKEQLYWIERTADIESAMAMQKFVDLVKCKPDLKNKKEMEMIQKIATELINLYTFLKEIRYKLENERNEKGKM